MTFLKNRVLENIEVVPTRMNLSRIILPFLLPPHPEIVNDEIFIQKSQS